MEPEVVLEELVERVDPLEVELQVQELAVVELQEDNYVQNHDRTEQYKEIV